MKVTTIQIATRFCGEHLTKRVIPDGSTSKSNILTEINYNKSNHKYGRKNYCRTTKITKK